MTAHTPDVMLLASLTVVAVSLVGLVLLRHSDTRLSRWLDRNVDDATRLPRSER